MTTDGYLPGESVAASKKLKGKTEINPSTQ